MALWTPSNLTSVILAGWYRVRDPNGVVAVGADVFDGTNVTRWKDRSGLGNDIPTLTQYANDQMVYNANGFGAGLASVRTKGIYWGTGWFGATNIPTGKIGAFSAITQASAQNTNGGRIISIGNVAGGNAGNQDYSTPNAIVLYNDGSDGTNITTYFGPTGRATVTPDVPLIAGSYLKNAGTLSRGLSINGTEVTTLTQQNYDNTPLNLGIGTNGAYAGGYWVGEHAEHIIFVGTLSLSEQQQLEGYLAWNNGTQGSLAANHPYKAAAPTIAGGGGTPPVIITPRRRPIMLICS
jgi:hypothetical protein